MNLIVLFTQYDIRNIINIKNRGSIKLFCKNLFHDNFMILLGTL